MLTYFVTQWQVVVFINIERTSLDNLQTENPDINFMSNKKSFIVSNLTNDYGGRSIVVSMGDCGSFDPSSNLGGLFIILKGEL